MLLFDMENWKKVFSIIWTGQFLSILSSSIVGYSIMFWMSLETGSAEVLAYAAIAGLLPQALLGVVAGVYVDRWDRKRIMILADSFIALCTLILAILFWLDVAKMWHIYLLLACRSVGSAFHMPAMQASVPLLAPESELVRIAGVNQIIQAVCSIAAPALGALFLGIMNLGSILILDVAGAAIACIALLFVTIPRVNVKREEYRLFRELKECFTEVRSKQDMGWFFFFSISVTFFIMPVAILFPLITLQHYSGDAFDMSVVEMAWGGGALLGGAIMGMRNYKFNKVALINLMYVSLGACFCGIGLLPADQFVWFVVLSALAGCTGAVYNSSFIGVIQLNIDPGVLGRVLSLFFSISILPSIIGVLWTGFLADTIGITTAFVIAGGIICLIGFSTFLIPGMMNLGKLKV